MEKKENYLPILIESLIFGKNSDYPLYNNAFLRKFTLLMSKKIG
ncbi:MAG: hypothetical protein M0012_04855 [Deltaproteobacteria bacterium]|nr:hypothetical protein [Deltaproteobacteria bacterium]